MHARIVRARLSSATLLFNSKRGILQCLRTLRLDLGLTDRALGLALGALGLNLLLGALRLILRTLELSLLSDCLGLTLRALGLSVLSNGPWELSD